MVVPLTKKDVLFLKKKFDVINGVDKSGLRHLEGKSGLSAATGLPIKIKMPSKKPNLK